MIRINYLNERLKDEIEARKKYYKRACGKDGDVKNGKIIKKVLTTLTAIWYSILVSRIVTLSRLDLIRMYLIC